MKVAVLTNFHERCGAAEYGRNLCKELSKYFEVSSTNVFPKSGYDVVVINWHPPVVKFSVTDLAAAKSAGEKVILIIQESFSSLHEVGPEDPLCQVAAFVAHEQMNVKTVRGGVANFRMIPHGLIEVVDSEYVMNNVPRLGTAGFAFLGKKMDVTVNAAANLGGRAVVVAPGHPWEDGDMVWRKICSMGVVELIREFLPVEEVIKKLATCDINIYAAQDSGPGQSGSCRMIIGAKRPTIVIRSRKTTGLYEYEDELYFVDRPDEITNVASDIWSSLKKGEKVKIPNSIIRDCNWSHVGEQYRDLVMEVCVEQTVRT